MLPGARRCRRRCWSRSWSRWWRCSSSPGPWSPCATRSRLSWRGGRGGRRRRCRSRRGDLSAARLRPGGGADRRLPLLLPASTEVAAQALIVGGGAAGDAAAAGLRAAGFSGPILLLAAEPHLPYQRPPLSKEYLTGRAGAAVLPLRPPEQYRELQVEVRTGARAAELDSDRRLVRLDSGERLAYDRLLLATGARPRRLLGLEDALHLREVDDADRLRAALLG